MISKPVTEILVIGKKIDVGRRLYFIINMNGKLVFGNRILTEFNIEIRM